VYYSAEAFLEQYEDADTGVLIVDQNMPGLTGLGLQQVIIGKHANLSKLYSLLPCTRPSTKWPSKMALFKCLKNHLPPKNC